MDTMTRKDRNRALAAAIRMEGGSPTGVTWALAKEHLGKPCCGDDFHKAAYTAIAGSVTQDVAPQAPAKKAPMKATPKAPTPTHEEPKPVVLSSRAKAVAAGRVMRDAKGRLLPTLTQEILAELASL